MSVSTRDLVIWEDLTIEHDLRVRTFRPRAGSAGWLVWAHGGSWTGGSIESWHPACDDLAVRAGATVVSVDYRLAPRHRHPAALDDIVRGMEWAVQRSAEEGLAGPVAVGGDSAGGTLAACAALRWRDLKRSLSAQVLAYPPLDPRCLSRSYRAGTFPTRAGLIAAWQEHRGPAYRPAARSHSTPLEASVLTGVAPAVIGVGRLDPVWDDVRLYADALRSAGGAVQMRAFPGMGHGEFLNMETQGDSDNNGSALRGWLASALRTRWGQLSHRAGGDAP